jgi:uncharacterized protein YyaL (SSP411 family)
VATLAERLDEIRFKLYAQRRQRPAPLLDDKILTAWNGLMISAFARAGLAFADSSYVKRASRAAEFLLGHRHTNRLYRSIKDDQPRHDAYLDDYAFLIAGLLDLHEASHDLRWFEAAVELQQILDSHYGDPAGGYFLTSDDHEALLAREKPSYDGAEPSGNSIALQNLLRLAELTTQERYREQAEALQRVFGSQLANSAPSLAEMLIGVDFQLDAAKEILIVTPNTLTEAEPLLAEVRVRFLPNRVLAVVNEDALKAHARMVPLLDRKVAQHDRATAYVCQQGVCELPTSDPSVFARQLDEVRPLAQ